MKQLTPEEIQAKAFPNPCPWFLKASIEYYLESGKISGTFAESLGKISSKSSIEEERKDAVRLDRLKLIERLDKIKFLHTKMHMASHCLQFIIELLTPKE